MMEFLKELTVWYNFIFIAPILLVLLYLILQIFGLAWELGGDIGADVGGDVDLDVDVDTTGIFSAFEHALAFINVGKVPLAVIISTFLMFWGITGYTSNGVIQYSLGSFPSAFIAASCSMALVVGIIATKFLSGIIARLFPEVESYSSSNQTLLGQIAEVVSGQVTPEFGRAKVKDQYGNVLTVYCKISEGKEVPKRGDEVVLLDYDPSDNKFEVIKADFADITQ